MLKATKGNMRFRSLLFAAICLFIFLGAVYGLQRGRLFFPDEEDNPAVIPDDANVPAEYQFARLRYPSLGGRGRRGRGTWSTDYPKADRQFVQGVRRLSRIHTRSIEVVVDLDSDEIFKYPWLYAVEVGYMDLNEEQAKRLREYLMRGGFLMVDDFHGTWEWQVFQTAMRMVFPDRPIVDIPDRDAIFHVLYDLDERSVVPGIQYLYTGRLYEQDTEEALWKAIYDDNGRIMVAITHNQDLGDAWEHADFPRYPENFASLAYRTGINYIIYSMTH